MKPIGIVICNYNKKDYVIKCIQSVFESSMKDFDIYVVDNASEDGSADALEETYGEKIQLIRNPENIGGSGGFNTGITTVLSKGYQYIMCLDNDVVVERQAIEAMYSFMEQNPDYGMVGAKILKMDQPDMIQEYGAKISFEKLSAELCYAGQLDRDVRNDKNDCDYVAACALMVRANVVQKVGSIPVEDYIYWDDIEWGYKIKLAGYKVASLGNAKVWHKGGASVVKNTFSTYYWYRNKTRFFARYIKDSEIEPFCETLLTEFYRASYACNYMGKDNKITSMAYAIEDGLQNFVGKAEDYKILPADQNIDKLAAYFNEFSKVYIKENGNAATKAKAVAKIRQINREAQFVETEDEAKTTIILCDHILEVQDIKQKGIYFDAWGNVITNEDEFNYCRNYKENHRLFMKMQLKVAVEKVKKLKLDK